MLNGGDDHDFKYNLIKMLGIVITNAEASVGNSKYLVFNRSLVSRILDTCSLTIALSACGTMNPLSQSFIHFLFLGATK